MKLSICNWNVLADCYVRGQAAKVIPSENADSAGKLPTAPTPSPTNWKIRSQLIRQCLISLKSDLYCLQEVDHFPDFYRPTFQEMGYHSHYLPRPGGKKDGCLIAYPMHRFEVLDVEEVDLDRLSYLDHLERSSLGDSRKYASLRSKYAKQNVALFVHLREKLSPLSTSMIVATCHIHWNPNLPEVKFAQTQLVLEELTRFRKNCQRSLSARPHNRLIPTILCGDFNSFPHDDLYALVTGKITLQPQQYFLQPFPASNDLSSLEMTDPLNGEGRRFLPSIKTLYGPNTKFLCDYSLSKLCRWMRILGIDVAMDSWESGKNSKPNPTNQPLEKEIAVTEDGTSTVEVIDAGSNGSTNTTTPSNNGTPLNGSIKTSSIHAFFQRARQEKRVILTSSKTLLERTLCPPSFYVHPNKLEQALVYIYTEYGLDLNRERFLTVCGKCGGQIEELEAFTDPRLLGKIIPTDRQIYACIQCAQPYWWNDEENSSPAKAMRKAEELYQMISRGMKRLSSSPDDTVANDSQILKKEEEADNEEVEEEAEDSKPPSERESTDSPLNLPEMFARRNQIISQGLLAQTNELLSDPSTSATTTVTVVTEVIKRTETGEKIQQLEGEEMVMSTETVDSTPLVQLQSIFANQEPQITNWSGEFQGTLDYIFVDQEQIHVKAAQVFPQLPGNGHLRPADVEESIREKVSGEIFHQTIETSQPSLTWPSDHFMLYAELLIE